MCIIHIMFYFSLCFHTNIWKKNHPETQKLMFPNMKPSTIPRLFSLCTNNYFLALCFFTCILRIVFCVHTSRHIIRLNISPSMIDLLCRRDSNSYIYFKIFISINICLHWKHSVIFIIVNSEWITTRILLRGSWCSVFSFLCVFADIFPVLSVVSYRRLKWIKNSFCFFNPFEIQVLK